MRKDFEKNLRMLVGSPEGAAAVSAMLFGVVSHLFGIVHVLHNYDNIAVQPWGYGTGITSGRWVLSLLGDLIGKLGGNYNLPTLNSLVFLLLLAVSAGFLVSALKIQRKLPAVLVGMIFSVFPTVTATMYFRYTIIYYGLAILWAVLAAWVVEKHRYGILISAVCTALSLGIYQAYVPMTIGIFVLQLLKKTLEGKRDLKSILLEGVRDCAALILGLVLYFICMKATLALYNTQLSNYQGVGEMGKLSLTRIPVLVWSAIRSFCAMPLYDYCALANTKLLRLIYLVLYAVTAAMIGYLLCRKTKGIGQRILAILLCVAFPVAVNFIVIMCPDTWIYTLMVYSFVLLPCVPLVLLDVFDGAEKPFYDALRKMVLLLAAVLACAYSYGANVSYVSVYHANLQTTNYFASIVTQARMTEGYTAQKQWALVGEIEDPLFHTYWQEVPYYDSTSSADVMVNKYSRRWWIENTYGYTLPYATDDQIQQVCATEEFREMPCWPDQGSIKVIGEMIVIKFQEPVY